jgi:hypothetical protein
MECESRGAVAAISSTCFSLHEVEHAVPNVEGRNRLFVEVNSPVSHSGQPVVRKIDILFGSPALQKFLP